MDKTKFINLIEVIVNSEMDEDEITQFEIDREDLFQQIFDGPITPQMTLFWKNTFPFGQEYLFFWSSVQISGMFPKAQKSTPTCTKQDQTVATICPPKRVRGGTFM